RDRGASVCFRARGPDDLRCRIHPGTAPRGRRTPPRRSRRCGGAARRAAPARFGCSGSLRPADPPTMTFPRHAVLLLALLGMAGWTVARGLRPLLAGLARSERFAWSIALGMTLETAIFAVILAFGGRPSAPALAGALAVAALAAAFRKWGRSAAEDRVGNLAAG